MSTTFFEGEEYSLTQYWGGEEKGICLQITPTNAGNKDGLSRPYAYISLTKEQVEDLVRRLKSWLKSIESTRFKKPLPVIICRNIEDDLYEIKWVEDGDVYGLGATLEEAYKDLIYNVEGYMALKDEPEENLDPELKELIDKLSEYVEVR